MKNNIKHTLNIISLLTFFACGKNFGKLMEDGHAIQLTDTLQRKESIPTEREEEKKEDIKVIFKSLKKGKSLEEKKTIINKLDACVFQSDNEEGIVIKNINGKQAYYYYKKYAGNGWEKLDDDKKINEALDSWAIIGVRNKQGFFKCSYAKYNSFSKNPSSTKSLMRMKSKLAEIGTLFLCSFAPLAVTLILASGGNIISSTVINCIMFITGCLLAFVTHRLYFSNSNSPYRFKDRPWW